jgi:hypothetical protein
MLNNIEKQPEKEPSVLEEEDFQELIENREISKDDQHLLEELARLPKDLFLEFHNYFTSNQYNLIKALENNIKIEDLRNAKDNKESERRKFLELYLELAKKYDWTALWNINVVFERRKKEKFSHIN